MSEGSDTGSYVQISIATSVRRAVPSDAAALAELVNRAYAVEASFIDGERTSPDEMAKLIEDGEFLVLEYQGGICAAVRYRGPGAQQGVPESGAYFGMLSVLPELQSMGLGRRLVEVAEAMAAAAGASTMHLKMINLREELARWYKGLGYRETGTAPYTARAVKKACHFVEMAKSLAPKAAQSASESLERAAAISASGPRPQA